MKFESVRLLHAQGVPDHYITNQIYQPIDDDHRACGSFIILFDHFGTPDGAFVASLTNTLIREYYRKTIDDRLSCFEDALVRVNDHIRQYALSREVSSLDLNGTIILFVHDEIHITHIGKPVTYLFREGAPLSLVDPGTNLPESEKVPTFSVITSGEVYEDDILALITPLQSPSVKHDLAFAIKHTPLYEAGRAYARVLKQKQERAAEALFVRFNPEIDQTFQVYLDRPLESTAEKIGQYQKIAQKQLSFFGSGISFIVENIAKRFSRARSVQRTPVVMSSAQSDDNLSPAPTPPIEQEISSPPPLHETNGSYQVKTYRKVATADAKPIKTATVTTQFSSTISPLQIPRLRPPRLRTLYLLVAALAFLIIVIRIVNTMPSMKLTTTDSIDRDAILREAESVKREADAAQVQDDTEAAIADLLQVIMLIGKIPEPSQTEASKVLLSQAQESLDTLTKTVQLLQGELPQNLDDIPLKIVASNSGTYVTLPQGSVQKYTETSVTTLKDIPTGLTFIDSVAYDNFQQLALLTETQQLYSVNTTNAEVKQLARTDGKAWPEASYLASFDKNLYFVGDTMWKAIPSGEKYRVIPYATEATTASVRSIIVNSGFFYVLEGDKQLLRLDAKGPKTPVKFYGVPETFLPSKIARVIASRREGTLYLLDLEKQRIIEVSTDGAYRRQFVLPKNAEYIDCDATDASFICASKDKQIETFRDAIKTP